MATSDTKIQSESSKPKTQRNFYDYDRSSSSSRLNFIQHPLSKGGIGLNIEPQKRLKKSKIKTENIR